MKTLLITIALASTIYAYTNWVNLTNTGKHSIDYRWTECYYKSMNNWTMSIVIEQAYCPYIIKYDPSANIWKK